MELSIISEYDEGSFQTVKKEDCRLLNFALMDLAVDSTFYYRGE